MGVAWATFGALPRAWRRVLRRERPPPVVSVPSWGLTFLRAVYSPATFRLRWCTLRVRSVCAPCTLRVRFCLHQRSFCLHQCSFGLHQGYLRFTPGLPAVSTRPSCVGCSWVWALAVITRGRLSLRVRYRALLVRTSFLFSTVVVFAVMTARFREAVDLDGTRRASGCAPAWAFSEVMNDLGVLARDRPPESCWRLASPSRPQRLTLDSGPQVAWETQHVLKRRNSTCSRCCGRRPRRRLRNRRTSGTLSTTIRSVVGREAEKVGGSTTGTHALSPPEAPAAGVRSCPPIFAISAAT